MEPEKGDPKIKVTVCDVAGGFRAAGAVPGDTVIYHGSLSSMGYVDGGPATVIEGALAAVNSNGTMAIPTSWYHGKKAGKKSEEFDVRTSPSNVGALSEYFRTDQRSIRSNDFSHSVSAIGARAAELTADHEKSEFLRTPWSNRAFGANSPWARLYDWNALYCFIGVSMEVCTMKHYIEARIVAECLSQATPEQQEHLASCLVRIGSPGIWPWYDSGKIGDFFAKRGLVATGRIGSATIRAIRTRTLVDETFLLLRDAPGDWFAADFLAWYKECLLRSCKNLSC